MLGIVDMAAKKAPCSDVVHSPVGAARKQTRYSSMMSPRMQNTEGPYEDAEKTPNGQ